MNNFYTYDGLTDEEAAETKRVRPLLLALGEAIMRGDEFSDARRLLESSGVSLSARVEGSDHVMLVAHYGSLKLPVLFLSDDAELCASQFPLYVEPDAECKPIQGAK